MYKLQSPAPRILARVARMPNSITLDVTQEAVQLGLVDGIITDDSDVFLFGGGRILRNMFNIIENSAHALRHSSEQSASSSVRVISDVR